MTALVVVALVALAFGGGEFHGAWWAARSNDVAIAKTLVLCLVVFLLAGGTAGFLSVSR